VTLFYDTVSPSVIPSSDSTLGVGLESIESMKRAALYARVSADAQQKEGTVESQVAELKRQIAVAGHVLIKACVVCVGRSRLWPSTSIMTIPMMGKVERKVRPARSVPVQSRNCPKMLGPK
jgi:hypothetical protein